VELNGKVAVVTGATRGIGRQVALELARRGAAVVLAARTIEARKTLPGTIAEVVAAIEAEGGRALGVRADMMRFEDLESVIAAAVETYGRLDILINNAASTTTKGHELADYPLESWLDQFQVNLHAPFYLMRLAIPHMRKAGGGVIVNLTSSTAEIAPMSPGGVDAHTRPGLGPLLGYVASKAGLARLTNAAAPGLLQDKIVAVTLDPGSVMTEMTEVLVERGLVERNRFQSMDVPVAKIMEVLTAANPQAYAGQIMRAGGPAA